MGQAAKGSEPVSEATWAFATLGAALVLFAGGWWRYDVVALLALLALTFAQVVPSEQAFDGFGHPAVITVAAVLVLSRGLQNAGVVEILTRRLLREDQRPSLQIVSLSSLVAGLSAFMNNVGALALLLPATLRIARESGRSPSALLMSVSFGSLLGGLCTLIGTPPNMIVAAALPAERGGSFSMFDFAPVGVGVTLAGLAFIAVLGWRLVPERRPAGGREALFSIDEYLTELRVEEESKLAGRTLGELSRTSEVEVIVVALLRDEHQIPAPSPHTVLQPGDVLLVEVEPESLQKLCHETGLALAGDKDREQALPDTEEIGVAEAVIAPGSLLIGRSVGQLNLRWRFGTNLLGVAREGHRVRRRLRDLSLRAGDILLLQGDAAVLAESIAQLGCLPLAERQLGIGQPRRLAVAGALFVAALGAAAFHLAPVQIAFAAAAVAMVVFGVLSLRDAYDAIDWPVIVLLGAMIPVGAALETSGGAAQIASILAAATDGLPPSVSIAALLTVAMLLSNVVNNAAAAVVMVPIAVEAAARNGGSPEAHLMAVAIGASCAFLTPIGHQNNTLVLGPGGFRFADYWRMGLPLSLVVAGVAVPLLLLFWPSAGAAG
jgi:di/tricarboxylate transporter